MKKVLLEDGNGKTTFTFSENLYFFYVRNQKLRKIIVKAHKNNAIPIKITKKKTM